MRHRRLPAAASRRPGWKSVEPRAKYPSCRGTRSRQQARAAPRKHTTASSARRSGPMPAPHGISPAPRRPMTDWPPAPVPGGEPALDELRDAAATCHGCDLWEHATQTVFGAGDAGAWLMLVGEQPGDKEDLTGSPFVGPAGEMLDRALDEAGIDRRRVYVTNVVKHFKWKPRGKRRIHQKPNVAEQRACRPWL